MQTVDERPETIHLYVVREEAPKPQLFPILLSLAALSVLFALCVLSPYQQPEERAVIRIPAAFLPLKVFTTSVSIIPTGVKTIPATYAYGTLTLTNGSVVSQELPKGLIFATFNRIEITTIAAVFVPAGNATEYGVAKVPAKAVVSGTQGNIPALSINAVYGTSLYIRNLTSFHGGKDSYTVSLQLPQDRQTAIGNARATLAAQQAKIQAFLAIPCNESSQEKNGILRLSWTCQFVSYSIPSYMRVTHIKLVGKMLLVVVEFVPRPHIIQFK